MNALVVVAAGKGNRMGCTTPKQFLNLAGKPLVLHTLERFFEYDPEIRTTLVLGTDHAPYWKKMAKTWPFADRVYTTTGGTTRPESVLNGLERVHENWIVAIHDAVRPLVSLDTIDRCFSAARKTGSGIPVIDLEDSVRRISPDGISEVVDRTGLLRVQTPQVFQAGKLIQAYRSTTLSGSRYTDDASVFESVYGKVTLVDGNPENIKITTPADLEFAASLIL